MSSAYENSGNVSFLLLYFVDENRVILKFLQLLIVYEWLGAVHTLLLVRVGVHVRMDLDPLTLFNQHPTERNKQ